MKRLLTLAVAAISLSPLLAGAQEWPTKTVRIIVPFAAGGAADAQGRLYADAFSAAFGKQFVVENRTGGGGIPGTEAVGRAEPDGYTLLVAGVPILVLGPAMNKNVGYDPMHDFVHIAYFGGTPNVLVAHPSLGVKTYRDLVELARSAPGGLEYVSAGFGTMGNWVAEYLARAKDIKLTHVAYKGGSAAMLDLIAGHVKVGMLTWSSVDRARPRRHARFRWRDLGGPAALHLPDCRPCASSVTPNFVATTWFSLSGPAGLAAEIVDKINGWWSRRWTGRETESRSSECDRDQGDDAAEVTPVRAMRDWALGPADRRSWTREPK